ncbi:4,5-dihydroxyphthalate decarboxylase [Kibdelosporangium aridum]|uniref:4,5-dihydroxyphthalate decarboxylase n=1 Tax=Kibdelosporangium aridum TaxID=2030 RepID=A0A1W2FLC3_KIBAR|nr:4,5-dihydroxyphthalate decarboxylase [Kibdelosporangium aridum]
MSRSPVLRTVTRTQGNNRALKDGGVTPRGFSFEFEEVPVLVDAFRRMVRGLEFDVSEMAFTTYLCAKAYGKPITALPVFPVRGFHHGAIVHNGTSAVSELEGSRVGVNRGYTVTTGVWARGILQDYYGVDLDKVTWVLSGDEHVAEYRPPANVVPMPQGGDLASMMASGELAAAIGVKGAPLIPDATEAAYEALRRDGLYPINHLVVVRDSVLAEHPGLAAEVFDAFAQAKQKYVAGLDTIPDPAPADVMYQRVKEITGRDPLPYGIAPNRPMIDKLIDHALRQGILDRRPAVEDLFAADTLDLTA